jgi:hypothetical protein
MNFVFRRNGAVEFQRRLRQRFRLRVIEWEHAVIAVGFGAIILGHPELFAGKVFQAPVFQWFGPGAWGWGVLLLGFARLLALAVNGYMARPTALIRSISAIVSVALFATISMGILFSGTTIAALAAFLPIVGFGVLPVYWAVIDVGVPDRHVDSA